MSFGFKRQNIYTMSTKEFSGIDLSDGEKNLLGKDAKMMENMFINENGKPEKRRGFRYIYKGENVNGVYEYFTEDNVFYILHEGEGIYLLEKEEDTYTKGELILSGAENKPSSGFVFGGSLYIMAGGYFKIGINKIFNVLEAGRVCLCSSRDLKQVVVTGRNQLALDGETTSVINGESESYVIKYNEGKYWFDGTTKLYVAPPEAHNLIRIEAVKVGSLTIDGYQYVTGCDDIGVFVKLARVNTNLKEFYEDTAEVTFSMGGFCYAAKNIVSRLAVGLDDLDGNIIEEHAAREHFSGEYLEDLNLASPLRKINFFVNLSDFSGATHIRFYLEPEKSKGKVLRITAGGNMIHSFYIQADNPYYKEQAVFSYESEYVDIKKSLLRELFSSDTEAVVEIEYIKTDFASEIDGCTVFGFYDSANDVRVFVSGNQKKGSYDYMSGIYDGTYFPALSYTSVGQDVSRILGYGRYFSYQLVFKDEKGDASLYFRCPDSNGQFKILKGAASEAAVSADAVINLNSRLFFLSDSGLFELSSTQVEGETKNVLRSKAINALLLKEDLKSLKLFKFSDCLYITGGKYVYVLDILKDYAWYVYSFPYEIKKAFSLSGDVFVTDGGIIREKEIGDNLPYADETEEERAVVAYFRTNDVLFKPYGKRNILNAYCILDDIFIRSGAEIFYHSDDYSDRLAKKETRDLFSFEDISFSRFSFFTERSGRSIKTNLRSKRVERFSLTIKNDNAENFIIEEIGFLYS